MTGKHDIAVTAFIDRYWSENCCSPTVREIMDAVGIPSSSTTRYVVRKVAKARGDQLIPNIARGIIPRWVQDAIRKAKNA